MLQIMEEEARGLVLAGRSGSLEGVREPLLKYVSDLFQGAERIPATIWCTNPEAFGTPNERLTIIGAEDVNMTVMGWEKIWEGNVFFTRKDGLTRRDFAVQRLREKQAEVKQRAETEIIALNREIEKVYSAGNS